MAMLAEPKRKQRWTLNPRGKDWSEDQNKFGQKILEKMGWTRGKGLGAKEQGMTEHVRVKFKDDQGGVGFNKDDYDKNWIEKQSGFNDLLLQLQKQSSNSKIIESEEKDELSEKSLEIKSEISRDKIRYKKFARGKDVNKYNSKDLANIFGKKDLNDKYPEISEKAKSENQVPFDDIGTIDHRNGVTTIKGGNMTDYFKNKQLAMKGSTSNGIKRERSNSDSETELRVGFGFNSFCSNEETNNIKTEQNLLGKFNNTSLITKKVKKDEIKIEVNTEENVEVHSDYYDDYDSTKQAVNYQSMPFNYEKKKNKKEKRKKKVKSEEIEIQNKDGSVDKNSSLIDINDITQEGNDIENEVKQEAGFVENEIKLKKDKSKKKLKAGNKKLEEISVTDIEIVNLDSSQVNIETINSEEIVEYSKSSKKSKKRKHKKYNSEENTMETTVDIETEENTENICQAKDKDISESVKKIRKEKSGRKTNIEVIDITLESRGLNSNFAYDNPNMMDVNEIDKDFCEFVKHETYNSIEESCTKNVNRIPDEMNGSYEVNSSDVGVINGEILEKKKKKRKEKNEKENMFVFENPCLMDINEIDNEDTIIENKEKSKKSKKEKNDSQFAFENPCLEDVNKIDKEATKLKQPKKKKIKIECDPVIEIIDNSKNQELEEKSNYAFGNPCLKDVQAIDNEIQKNNKRKLRDIDEADFKSPDISNKIKKIKKDLQVEKDIHSNEESCNGNQFEVPRKHFGVVNNGLDLTDETVGKRRVTFNDQVEYNTDVKQNKKGKKKLDKYEVENKKKKKMMTRFTQKTRITKHELKAFFLKNPNLEFNESNINYIKGYRCN